MRLFDLIGAAAVAVWLGLVGFYVFHVYFEEEAENLVGGVVIQEGESWMLLTREEEEVGYIHETRTRLDGDLGWLLEYDLLVNVQMLGIDQFLRTTIKASVDESALLEKFAATIEAANTTFKLEGRVEGNTVTMSADLGGEVREQKIELKERPRLANSAVHELVAAENLEPGRRFEQQYFDPTVMGMTTITFEYVRPHKVMVYEQEIDTLHFRQLVAGNELDVYVDRNGEVYIQEFPFRILGARVPETFGQSRAQAMRREFEQGTRDGVDLSMETAVGLLKGMDAALGTDVTRYEITNIPDGVNLMLESSEQKVVRKNEHSALVDTAQKAPSNDALAPEAKAAYLAADLRVDADAAAFGELLSKEDRDRSATARAESLAQSLKKRIRPKGEVGVQTASQVLEKGEGDCTEYALAYVAALRHHRIPARFVSGVKSDEKAALVPHQWVQYWNDTEFVDVDLSTPTMLVGTGHLQLFTHAQPEHPEFVHVLDQIQIEPLAPEKPADPTGVPSDFN